MQLEVLGYVHEEVCKVRNTCQLLTSSFLHSYPCQVCLSCIPEPPSGYPGKQILHLAVWESVANSMSKMLLADITTQHCNPCGSNQEFFHQLTFTDLPEVFIVWVQRAQFNVLSGAHQVDNTVTCERQLSIGSGRAEGALPLCLPDTSSWLSSTTLVNLHLEDIISQLFKIPEQIKCGNMMMDL